MTDPQAARETLRPDPLTDSPEEWRDPGLSAALRAATPDPAEPDPDQNVWDMLDQFSGDHEPHRGNHEGYSCGLSGPHCWLCNEPWPCRSERGVSTGPHTPHNPPDYLRSAAEAVVGAWYAGTGPATDVQVRARAIAVAHLAAVLKDVPRAATPDETA